MRRDDSNSKPAGLDEPIDRTRRHLLHAMLAFPTAGLIGFTGSTSVWSVLSSRVEVLPLTPACDDGDDDETPAQTEGPYFKPHSPERRTIVASSDVSPSMVPLTITGRVMSAGCTPIAGALLDFWQADHEGRYDNAGFNLRGHQYTDDDGRFSLTTIVPGVYPGRTRHVHVKAQAPNQPALTTQLYFPGEPRNATDSLFAAPLLLNVRDGNRGRIATFDFVLPSRDRRGRARTA
jgi:protocatechuate 3,4-dioxygenase beta subunit